MRLRLFARRGVDRFGASPMMDKSTARGHATVLIVEDQALLRAALRGFLQIAFASCSFVEADDGASALKACKACRPDVVLMDKCLPDADGIELTCRLRVIYPGIQVIVMSQHSGDIYMQRALAAGARTYLVKDCLPAELIPAVASAIGIAAAAGTGTSS